MSRMIDLIRASAVPSNLMQSAAKGSLSVPPREMIEILVHLAVHNSVFGEQAQLTLAGWDQAASQAVAADPKTAKEVLDYLISPKNLRPALLPALLANPAVTEESLIEMAPGAGRDVVELMLKSERVNGSLAILKALFSNHNLSGIQSESIRSKIEPPAPAVAPEVEAPAEVPLPQEVMAGPEEVFQADSPPTRSVKARMYSMKACWPICLSTPMRSPPRPTTAISRSAAFMTSSQGPKNPW
jgi:hypothetical protein